MQNIKTAPKKWAAFCAETDDPNAVVLRFLSTKGHMTFGHPYRYAKELNPRLLVLCESQDISLGWTVIDFGNAQLASAIYQLFFGQCTFSAKEWMLERMKGSSSR